MTSARVAEVQQLLRRRAYDRREEFGAVLTWFLAEGVALRLARHKEIRDQLVLSGDLMLHALLGGAAPFEWQAELLAVGPICTTELEECLREVCDVEVDDGLDLELPAGGVAGPIAMEGGRCSVVTLIGRLGSIELSLPVLVRLDEQVRQKPCNYFFESVLGSSLTARVIACPPPVLAALRLRAAVGMGAAPTGVKVLWDLYRLIESGKAEPSLVAGAIADAFVDRGVPAPKAVPLLLSEEFALDASRQKVWAAFLQRARVQAPVLGEVVRRVGRQAWPWLIQGVSRAAP